MSISWPNSLNYILDRGSYSIDPHADLARSEFEDGPSLVRQRFSNPTAIYNGTLTFTNNEYQTFRGFYMNILSQGSRWFEIPIWQGTEYTLHKARFKQKYEVKDEGWNQYTVSISLEVRKYFTYDYFTSYIIGFFGLPNAVTEVADPLQRIVNIEYPEVTDFYTYEDYVRFLILYYGSDFLVEDFADPLDVAINVNYYEVFN